MLSMIFLLLHLMTTASDHILHNCGGPSEQDSGGHNWTSDAYYPECFPPNEQDISVTYKDKATESGSASVPYLSVHIFVNQCTRSYPVSPGPKFIRLHFSPTTHYTVNGFSQQPKDSFFSVNANEYTLVANFSAFLAVSVASADPVVEKEYIVNVNGNRLDITFTPSPGSFAFVNRIGDGANSIVAVKRLNKAESRQGEKEFWMEIKMLSNLRNHNLVSLNGYCDEEQEMLLVYEYMEGGTLANHLYKIDDDNPSSLSWEERLKICLGAARGLQYLHAANVIHRDVKKTSNILLDQTLVAKISDFGLSKIGPGSDSFTHISTDVKGTFGYLDPEYFLTRRLTTKSDVFAFGVVLFEVLSGRPALDMKLVVEEQHSLATWAVECIRKGEINQMFDRCLVGQMSPACSKVFVEIAGRCLLREPRQRPDMADVVKNLELALALQQRAAELAVNVSIIGRDNPASKGWSSYYLVRSHLYQLFVRGKFVQSGQ